MPLPLWSEELDRIESDIQSNRADRMMCQNGGGAQKVRESTNLCQPQATQSVLREVHSFPKVDETLAQLAGAKMFSKLDANSGCLVDFGRFLCLSPRLLTSFITPMGCYCFNKLPFGISSAPEHFQRRMTWSWRSPLSDGRHSHLWKRSNWAWSTTCWGSTHVYRGSRSDPQPQKVRI